MTDQPTFRVTDVVAVAVPVTDQDRALDFYVGVLGCEKLADDLVEDGFRWVEVRPAGAATGIALLAAEADSPAGVDTGIRLAATDAAAAHRALEASGVKVGDLLLWEGAPPMFVFCDPDGNRLYLVEQN